MHVDHFYGAFEGPVFLFFFYFKAWSLTIIICNGIFRKANA